MNKGFFTLVSEHKVNGCRIYESRFVDEIKHTGTFDASTRSRPVVITYNEYQHRLLSVASTVENSLQQLKLAVFEIFSDFLIFMREISQAHTKLKTKISRLIYLRPPSIFNTPCEMILCVDRPLYGLSETGLHWFVTYYEQYHSRLAMTSVVPDSCLLYINFHLSVRKFASLCRWPRDNMHED